MEYREIAPAAALRTHVACFWSVRGDEAGAPAPILPDGSVDLIFSYRTPLRLARAAGTLPRAMVSANVSIPIMLAPMLRVELFGIRLRLGAAAALLDAPARDFTNAVTSCDALAPVGLRGGLSSLLSSESDADRIRRAEEALLKSLSRAHIDRRCADAIRRLESGCGSVGAIAHALGLTPRHLERLFLAQVGVGPKTLAQVLRFQRASALVQAGSPLVDAAAAAGYADQAHLARAFRRFAVLTPGQLKALSRADLNVGFVQERPRAI